MAQHISNIQERGYAVKQNNYFSPTKFGLALYEAYEQMNLDMTKPNLRRRVSIVSKMNYYASLYNKNKNETNLIA